MPTRRATRSTRPALVPVSVRESDQSWWVLLALILATFAAYQPAWHGGLLWDDDAHLIPPTLASVSGLGRIWTDFQVTQQYYPIVNTAFWIMNRLWGTETFGYHAVNIVLHACSAWLVFVILKRWSMKGALTAAALFALHPVQVESVAWMSELKNTLSGVFYLLAAFAYFRFDESRDRRWYLAAFAAFVLALGSKTVTATLPAALAVVLWWRHGRLDWRRDLVPLAPMLVVGVVAGVVTAWLEVAWVGAHGESFGLSGIQRVLLAGRAAWFYGAKAVWPAPLMFMYPRWSIDASALWQYVFPIALAAAIAGLWWMRHRARGPLAAALFFCGTLFPALGFVNVFPFRYSFVADHFQYLAILGVLVPVSIGATSVLQRWRPGLQEWVIAALLAAPLFVLTYRQSQFYVDAETLYRATLDANPSSLLAHNNLAALLLDGPESGWAEAERHATAAIAIAPDDAAAHNNLGLVRQRAGRFEDSVREHREAIRLDPEMAAAHYNLGISLGALNRLDESAAAYRESLRIFPSQAAARSNLGQLLARQGRLAEGAEEIRAAIAIDPDSPDMRMNLANVLLAGGDNEAAIAAYDQALVLRPGWGEASYNKGMALRRVSRTNDALVAFQAAEAALPGSAQVQVGLASLLVSMGRLEEAVMHYERALQLPNPPRPADLHNDVGLVLAQLGRLPAAIVHFEAAIRLRPDFASARANLARALRGGR